MGEAQMMRSFVLACCIAVAIGAPVQSVHPERAAQIEKIQNTKGVLWKAGPHPRFAAEAPGASKTLMGVIGDQQQAVAEMMAKGEIVNDTSTADDIPDSFD